MAPAHDKPEWAQSRHEKRNAERVAQGLKPGRRLWPWIVLILVVAGAVAAIVLRPAVPTPNAEVTAETPVVKQLLRSEITEVAPTTLSQTVKVTGTLVPARQSEVASQASGRVLTVAVRPGDSVEAGDTLAEIDRANLQLQLDQQRATADATRAQLNSSQQQLDRTVELERQGLATPSALEQARSATTALAANLLALETAVQTAELALSDATVTAPFDGVVSSRTVEPGQTISAGSPLFTIVNLDEMEFQASASVNSSALVAPDQAVVVTVTGIEGRTFVGDVTRVNPVAVSGTRTVPIYIALDNADALLRGGMFATGLITVAQQADAIALPATALREDAEGQFVLKLSDGVLVRQAVEPGDEWDRGRIVQVGGVAAGDMIVSAPLPELAADDQFQIVED